MSTQASLTSLLCLGPVRLTPGSEHSWRGGVSLEAWVQPDPEQKNFYAWNRTHQALFWSPRSTWQSSLAFTLGPLPGKANCHPPLAHVPQLQQWNLTCGEESTFTTLWFSEKPFYHKVFQILDTKCCYNQKNCVTDLENLHKISPPTPIIN